jgi:outer membrane immunogenic protein
MRKLAAARAALLVRSLSAKTNDKTNDLTDVRSRAPLCHSLALSGARTHHLVAGALGWMVAASLTAPAAGADLSAAPARPAPAVPYAFSWAGSYLGVNLGGAWSSLDLQATSLGSRSSLSSSSNGAVIGGFQSGRNWQFGQLVLGFEGDTQFTGPGRSVAVDAPFGLLQAGDAFKTKTDFTSSSRARAGWAWDRFMVYGTGGLATALIDVSASYGARGPGSPAFEIDRKNQFRFGYTVGAGIEYAVTDRTSLGLEYRYTDLGRKNYDLGEPASVADLHLKSSTVTARLNVKFDGFGLLGGRRSP